MNGYAAMWGGEVVLNKNGEGKYFFPYTLSPFKGHFTPSLLHKIHRAHN